MIPEPNKLNWSTVKPTFEEVNGSTLIIEWSKGTDLVVMTNKQRFHGWFDGDFIRYAIIEEPDPEPQPLWGVMPEIVNVGKKTVVCLVIPDKYYFEIQRFDRDEAINAWNKLAKPLNEIQP